MLFTARSRSPSPTLRTPQASPPASPVSSAPSTPPALRIDRLDLEDEHYVRFENYIDDNDIDADDDDNNDGNNNDDNANTAPSLPGVSQFWHDVQTNNRPVRTQVPRGFRSRLNEMRPLNLGRCDVPCPYCGAKHWIGERKSGSSKRNPVFQDCCKAGKIDIASLPDPPPLLMALWDGSDPRSAEFRKNIRKYNSAFAFTSFQYSQNQSVTALGGFQVFQIHGAAYHLQGHIGQAQPDKEPRFAQLYFYDADEVFIIYPPLSSITPFPLTRSLTLIIGQHLPAHSLQP